MCLQAWFSYVADDRRVIVSNHSRRKFTKDFTHEQSPTIVVEIVVADVGDTREPGCTNSDNYNLLSKTISNDMEKDSCGQQYTGCIKKTERFEI